MEIHTIGIDLGKTVFHLVGLGSRGEVVVRKKCSRNQILRFTANCMCHQSAWKPAEELTFLPGPCASRGMMQG
jgi:hypothetical protein